MKNKRMKKLFKGMLAGTMALSVIMGSALTASAATGWNDVTTDDNTGKVTGGGYTEGTQENPAEAFIMKSLWMAEGTNTPKGTFKFQFMPKSVDGSEEKKDTDAMPKIPNAEASYEKGRLEAEGGLIKANKLTGNVLEEVKESFDHAGEYVYTVSEVQDPDDQSVGYKGYDFQSHEYMKYSKAQYKMTVITANQKNEDGSFISDGKGGYKTYIKYVTVEKVKDDDNQDVQGKVNTENDTGKNGFIFNNEFTRIGNTVPNKPTDPSYPGDPAKPDDPTNPSDPNYPTDPEHPTEPVDPTNPNAHNALVISKTVASEVLNLNNTYEFKLKLTKSALATEESYDAYVYENGNKTETKKTFKVGEETTFSLKHNQSLVFPLLPTGTRYTLTETGGDYTATINYMEDGKKKATVNGEANKDTTTGDRLVGDEDNYAKVSNDKQATPPTGILINNLPFIALILVAVGAFAAFVVSRKRRRA